MYLFEELLGRANVESNGGGFDWGDLCSVVEFLDREALFDLIPAHAVYLVAFMSDGGWVCGYCRRCDDVSRRGCAKQSEAHKNEKKNPVRDVFFFHLAKRGKERRVEKIEKRSIKDLFILPGKVMAESVYKVDKIRCMDVEVCYER